MSVRCALVVGHKASSPGALNRDSGLSEYEFNDNLADLIIRKVTEAEIRKIYRRTFKELPDDINRLNPDLIVSLHCNAYDGFVSGTETLYYHKSEKGKNLAGILQRNLVKALGFQDRGIKPKNSEDRGGYLLRYTHSPCVIAEPFFIDNNDNLRTAQEKLDNLAAAYADSIETFAGTI